MFRDESRFTTYYTTKRREVIGGANSIEFGILASVSSERNFSLFASLKRRPTDKREKKRAKEKKMTLRERWDWRRPRLSLSLSRKLSAAGRRECNRVVISSWASLYRPPPPPRIIPLNLKRKRNALGPGPSWPGFVDSRFCQQMA